MRPKLLKKVTFQDTKADIVEEEIPKLEPSQILVKTRCSLISPFGARADQ